MANTGIEAIRPVKIEVDRVRLNPRDNIMAADGSLEGDRARH
jgi:hypothetical protein